jgi:gamma-glutamyl:cysteine ligase YbdK (ATP-grasp superfamily)
MTTTLQSVLSPYSLAAVILLAATGMAHSASNICIILGSRNGPRRRTFRASRCLCLALVTSGAIPKATHVWWSTRPSDKCPILELRATDCCTPIDDATAIAALYRCFGPPSLPLSIGQS